MLFFFLFRPDVGLSSFLTWFMVSFVILFCRNRFFPRKFVLSLVESFIFSPLCLVFLESLFISVFCLCRFVFWSYDTFLFLIPKVAHEFADLHDRSGRMKAKGVVRDIIDWKSSRQYFYWRVKRRLAEKEIRKMLKAADPSLPSRTRRR